MGCAARVRTDEKNDQKGVNMKDTDDSLNENHQQTESVVNEDNPEWDGSEAELVADDDAEEYEIPETGIRLSYVMTRKEMYECIQHTGLFKTRGKRAVLESVVFGLASVGFWMAYFLRDGEWKNMNLFFAIFCLVMILLIWLVPFLHIRSLSRNAADGKTIHAEIYPDHIDIGEGSGAWSIDLDGNCELSEFENIFMISLSDGRNFAIPERVLEPEVYNEVQAILVAGTRPTEI